MFSDGAGDFESGFLAMLAGTGTVFFRCVQMFGESGLGPALRGDTGETTLGLLRPTLSGTVGFSSVSLSV